MKKEKSGNERQTDAQCVPPRRYQIHGSPLSKNCRTIRFLKIAVYRRRLGTTWVCGEPPVNRFFEKTTMLCRVLFKPYTASSNRSTAFKINMGIAPSLLKKLSYFNHAIHITYNIKTILAKKQEIEYNNIRSAAIGLLCKVLTHLRKRERCCSIFPPLHFLFSHAYYISLRWILQDVFAKK